MESSALLDNFPINQIQAIEELTRGKELMNILDETLWWPNMLEFDCTPEDGLVTQIQSMFENALSVMCSHSPSESTPQFTASDSHTLGSSRLNEPRAKHSDQTLKSRKPMKIRRKNSWTSTQISSVLVDDGHVWRKYGQKHIQKEKYHRSYYRCTYKFDQKCLATKQVQMIQENPPKYRTTYIRNHTCKNLLRTPQIILDTSHGRDSSILLSFETNGLVEKKHVDNNSQSSSNSESSYLACDPNVCVSQQSLEHTRMTSEANVANLHVALGSQLIQQLQTNCYYYPL